MLLIHVQIPVTICVGQLGNVEFVAGWYAYVGSAMGRTSTTLHSRLKRHFAPLSQKKLHWHVDYLLAWPQIVLAGALAVPSIERLECKIVQLLRGANCQFWGPRFGASDCTVCPSHLLLIRLVEENNLSDSILLKMQKEIQKQYPEVQMVLPPDA
jgi:Uri superfamily endonuclease